MMEQWYLYKKKADFNQIGEKFNIDPVIARLIRNRDVVGDEQIQQYLYGELSDISDPFLMKGVKEEPACTRWPTAAALRPRRNL